MKDEERTSEKKRQKKKKQTKVIERRHTIESRKTGNRGMKELKNKDLRNTEKKEERFITGNGANEK